MSFRLKLGHATLFLFIWPLTFFYYDMHLLFTYFNGLIFVVCVLIGICKKKIQKREAKRKAKKKSLLFELFSRYGLFYVLSHQFNSYR